jgi:sugar lactone lactonase YvrE
MTARRAWIALAIFLIVAIHFVDLTIAQAAFGAEILIVDANSEPESLTIAPGGILFIGSASTPFVYKVRPGSTTAERFVDASIDGAGTFFFGMLADAATNTLWTCELIPVPGATPANHHTALRGFDLSGGAQKLRWNLPGDNSVCNDFSLGPDKALYITDTINGRIYKLKTGDTTAELFLENNTLLKGVDGITFLHGKLYVTNVFTDKLYRIPVDAAGKAGQPVELLMDQPVKAPDGMRAFREKLLLADSGNGKIDVLTLNRDKAKVRVIKEGLNTPTAVEPAGSTIWIAERGTGKAVSIPMPK